MTSFWNTSPRKQAHIQYQILTMCFLLYSYVFCSHRSDPNDVNNLFQLSISIYNKRSCMYAFQPYLTAFESNRNNLLMQNHQGVKARRYKKVLIWQIGCRFLSIYISIYDEKCIYYRVCTKSIVMECEADYVFRLWIRAFNNAVYKLHVMLLKKQYQITTLVDCRLSMVMYFFNVYSIILKICL